MLKIRLYANADSSRAQGRRDEVASVAAANGLAAVTDGAADVLVALGGDGTILRAVHEFPDLPVLGLNCGGLGYLSSVGEDDFARALALLGAGRFSVSERTLLEADGRYRALNDIVVMREMSGHAVRLDLTADGTFVTRYMADGLIFATPTGSTAYSLAAGGPVLMPDSASVVVTPLNPHALGVRPLVTRDDVRFAVTARARSGANAFKTAVYVDGEPVRLLGDGEMVAISKSPKTAKLVALEGYDPYDVLAHKLGWSGSNVK